MKYGILFLLYSISFHSLFAQSEPDISTTAVISNYFKAIGGKSAWKNLKSRKSKEKYLVYSSGMIESVSKTIPFVEFYQFPNNYLTIHTKDLHWNLVVSTSDCAWIYFGKTESIFFRSKEYIRDKEKYPRVEALEFFNLPIEGEVTQEDGFYKIAFEDKYGGRLVSVYFDTTTFLIEKYTYYSRHSFHEKIYSDYRTKDGFTEPYRMDEYVDDKKFMSVIKEDITYNAQLNSAIFTPPMSCPPFEEMTKLEKPLPNIYSY